MPTDQDVDQYDDLDQDIQDIDQDDSQVKKRGRWKKPLILIVVLLVFVGSLTAVFGFNVLNVRDGFVYPALRGVPFVGSLVPPAGDFVYEYEYVYEEGEWHLVAVPVFVPYEPTPQEDVVDVEALLLELEELRIALAQAEAINDESSRTIVAMRESHDFITYYRQSRAEFEEMIALGDQDAFLTFFSMVDPDRAANIYAHIRAANQLDRDFRRYASTYHRMDTGEAAEVFTLLLTMNPDLLIDILWTFNNDQRAEIFNEMEAEHVAIITILMEPDMDPTGILAPIQIIDAPIAPPVPVFAAVADAAPTPTEPEEDGEEEAEDEESEMEEV